MQAAQIIEGVCRHAGVDFEVIASASTVSSIVQVRAELMYALRELGGLSNAEIGELVGGRDHRTVSTQIQRVRERLVPIADCGAYDYGAYGHYDRHIRGLFDAVRAMPPLPSLASRSDTTEIARARSILRADAVDLREAQKSAAVLLSVASILADQAISATEARLAALQILGGWHG